MFNGIHNVIPLTDQHW